MDVKEIKIDIIKLFICPICNEEIPQIKLLVSDCGIEIETKCLSPANKLKNNNQKVRKYSLEEYFKRTDCLKHDKPGIEYCLNTYTWLCRSCVTTDDNTIHSYLQSKDILLCRYHHQPLQYFNSSSKTYKCFSCCYDDKHDENRDALRIPFICSFKKATFAYDDIEIDSILNHNKHLKNIFITELDHQTNSVGLDDKELTQMKDKIECLYQQNSNMNLNLIIFFKALVNAINSMKPLMHYELNKVLSLFQINQIKATISKTNIRADFQALKDYYTQEFVFKEVIKSNHTIKAHSDWICSLVSLSNNKFASGSADYSIKIYNSTTFELEGTMLGHERAVIFLLQLKDGRLASGADDSFIKLWDTSSMKCITTLKGHQDSIYCLCQLHDNQLASCSGDGTIKLWDHYLFKCNATLIGDPKVIRHITQLNDLSLASGSHDYSIKIWDIKSRKCKGSLTGSHSNQLCLLQLYDTQLASGSD